jgi:uncharacterized DUF497 family protein
MSFIWERWNREHLQKHEVSTQEAQYIVEHRQPPFPQPLGNGKFIVRGRTRNGRYLQVIYCFKADEDLDYEEMDVETMIELADSKAPHYYVVHARNLTAKEISRFRRSQKP